MFDSPAHHDHTDAVGRHASFRRKATRGCKGSLVNNPDFTGAHDSRSIGALPVEQGPGLPFNLNGEVVVGGNCRHEFASFKKAWQTKVYQIDTDLPARGLK